MERNPGLSWRDHDAVKTGPPGLDFYVKLRRSQRVALRRDVMRN
jgi:hypothetical protein